MTKDDIISLPNKRLRTKSKIIKAITPTIKKTVQQMIDATISWDKSRDHEVGVALAAIQINKLYRIIIVREDHENKDNMQFKALINPEITKLEGDIIEDFEGCLSVPNVYGKVPRYSKVRIKALDINGQPITMRANGFMARILQHEVDHTNGIVFIDKIKDREESFYYLSSDGNLKPVNYEDEIKNNPILW